MDLHKPRMDGYVVSDSILAEDDVVGPWDPTAEHSWMNLGQGQTVPWAVMVENAGKPLDQPHDPRDLEARAVMLARDSDCGFGAQGWPMGVLGRSRSWVLRSLGLGRASRLPMQKGCSSAPRLWTT